jgi:hypothetical protein
MAVPGGPGLVGAVAQGTGISISTSGVISAVTYNGSNPPPAPTIGTLWYDTTVVPGVLKVWDGSQWVPVGSGATTLAGLGLIGTEPNSVLKVKITTASAPPVIGTTTATGAVDGSLYWDDNLGELFIRYNDGTSSQWVQTNYGESGGGGGGGVTSISVIGQNGIITTGSPVTTTGTISVSFPIQSLPALP